MTLPPIQASDIDAILIELLAKRWHITVKIAGVHGYEASVIRPGGAIVGGAKAPTPARALMAAARQAIEAQDTKIKKLRGS